jgi:hypothetical protein
MATTVDHFQAILLGERRGCFVWRYPSHQTESPSSLSDTLEGASSEQRLPYKNIYGYTQAVVDEAGSKVPTNAGEALHSEELAPTL